ncbi:MAG: murein biosynthesis integral membrane protein MurJ, partial [Chloroflexota bacterium]|nr:murein biosynthesis integral membrane protein MurJ [Chloroflexota bacterium]
MRMSQASQVIRLEQPLSIDEVIDELPQQPESQQVVRTGVRGRSTLATSALIVAAAFVLSRVLGLGREIILARQFGTGPEMDAYVSAFRIPDLLFLVVMAGAFGAAFIPVFGQYLEVDDQDRAWRLASSVLTWAGVSVVVLSGLCFLLARPLMFVVAPGFDQQTEDMAVQLMRILLLSPVFLGLGIAAKGILEAHNQFTFPAIAPLVYNVAIIIGAVFFVPEYGIYAVGWAVIFGALGHFLIQTPGLIRAGMRFRPSLDRNVDGLGEVARLFGPRVVGLAVFQVNFIAVTAFASTTGDESVSAINYAWQLLMLPHGVLALSISTVAFPTLAALYSRGDKEQFATTLDRTLRPLLFLSIPSGIGLLLLRKPIVQVIFESGNFDAASTRLVIAPLAAFAAGLLGYALTEILTRVFYALRDTMTPVITGVLTVLLNLLLCVLFMESLGYTGLALALSVTTGAEAVILLLFLRVRIGHVVGAGFGKWLFKVTGASIAMTAVIVLTAPWLESALERDGSHLPAFALFAYAMGVYAFAFMASAWMFRIPELQQVVSKVGNRLPDPIRSMLVRLDL